MLGLRKNPTRGVKVVADEAVKRKVERWDVQRPRLFFRREIEAEPMVIKKR
jgi:hypothetical protein